MDGLAYDIENHETPRPTRSRRKPDFYIPPALVPAPTRCDDARHASASGVPRNRNPAPEAKSKKLPEYERADIEARVKKQLHALIDFSGVNETSVCPEPPSFHQHVAWAQQFRDHVDKSCDLTLCAVCAIPQADVVALHIDHLPNKDLLRADGDKDDPTAPRHALTVCTIKKVKYCLQPDGVIVSGTPLRKNTVRVCASCQKDLKRGVIPKESLVRVDAGIIPQSPNPKLNLAPLRMLEERMVSRIRTLGKLVLLIKTDGPSNLPPDCRQMCSKGHVIAFPNVEPQQLVNALLMPLNAVPETLQVVFLNIANNYADLVKLAAACKAIHVRGREVLKWAVHLCSVRITNALWLHRTWNGLVVPCYITWQGPTNTPLSLHHSSTRISHLAVTRRYTAYRCLPSNCKMLMTNSTIACYRDSSRTPSMPRRKTNSWRSLRPSLGTDKAWPTHMSTQATRVSAKWAMSCYDEMLRWLAYCRVHLQTLALMPCPPTAYRRDG